jgi:hypothetical protein
MKVYVATSGDPGEYDYEVLRVFAHREHAKAYELGTRVLEFEVDEEPLDVKTRHVVTWDTGMDRPPSISHYTAAVDGREDTLEYSTEAPYEQAETWDPLHAKVLFGLRRREYEAFQDEIAAELLGRLGRIFVQVWYEPGDGKAILLTPLHSTQDHFGVPRDSITDEAGMPRGETLHGKWFTVEKLTRRKAEGFQAVARPPGDVALARDTPTPVQPFKRVP